MNEYEIRILKADGTPSLIVEESHLIDGSAIRSARMMANNNAVEVWRGIECIWRSSALIARLRWKRAAANHLHMKTSGEAE